MQMKMKALDLSEFDFESIFSTENEISQYLEIVDLYFQELYMVKKYLDDLYAHQYADYEGEDKNEIIHSTSVNNLKYFIASFDELKNIFSYKKDTPIDVIKIYNHGRIQDFSKFIASTQKNNLSFDWDDAIKFFSIENDTTMNGKNVIGKLYGAYIHLSKVIFDQELLKNILKMAANSEHSYTIHFLNTLETMSDGEMKLLEKYYPDMVML